MFCVIGCLVDVCIVCVCGVFSASWRLPAPLLHLLGPPLRANSHPRPITQPPTNNINNQYITTNQHTG